ncbi:SGNH/GDSL hydrolase family protein [Akkermansiaceae bacterium]|nr:SGNH/GDSL hydrolase family protein [Akkermansiaceae bacterium]
MKTLRGTPHFLFLHLLLLLPHGSHALEEIPQSAATKLDGVKRIVFLGDSITQGGDYVTDFECGLLANGIRAEVLNLGLGSETASDLTEEENSGHLKAHRFGRPAVSERLEGALAATKPDLLIVCYGMNDGSSLPANEAGTQRFAGAIMSLRETALKSGVKRVVLCTPPVRDDKGNAALRFHDESLARYTEWLLSKRADGWDVVDIHGPMRNALDEGRAKDPAFALSGDGVHPGREGHWIMAREILTQFLGLHLDDVVNSEALFPANGAEIRKLANQRMRVLFEAWMTKIGHARPGVAGGPGAKAGPTIEQANKTASAITGRIEAFLPSKP